MKKSRQSEDNKVSISSFPASKKVYVEGSQTDIRVPFREIEQSPTLTARGEEINSSIQVYDTSGPYTDPNVQIDIEKGVPSVRSRWVSERGGVEEYSGRESKPEDNGYKDSEHGQSFHFPGATTKATSSKTRGKCNANALCT